MNSICLIARSRPSAPGLIHAISSPIVEIFQGYHTSYEAPGAPRTGDDKTDRVHGPYKPDGFVSLALDKGYRFGFQSSSDHISTHISYAIALAEDHTRAAILDAFKRRHCYAATDNILLDVRSGEHIMGDDFEVSGPVELRAVSVDVEVHHPHAVEVDGVGDPPQLDVADHGRAEVASGARREDRIPLPCHRRPQEPVVECGDGARADRE